MSNMLFFSVLLCLIVGSAIDTSNICVVRAAGNLTAGRPAMAVSVLFATACATVVFFFNTRLGLLRQPPPWSYPTLITFTGAILFATGALVNGACAIGTVGRLARGDIGYFATMAGALVIALFIPHTMIESKEPDLLALTGSTWLWIILALSAVLMLISRKHLRARSLASYAMLGVAAALVSNWQGNWTWLGLIQVLGIGMPMQYAVLACVSAVVLGAAVTAVATGRFHFVRPDPWRMAREAAGGGLMAAGAIFIPGGNDALLVFGIPSGSPHAIMAYVLMFAVMLMVLQVKPLLRHWLAWAGPGAAP